MERISKTLIKITHIQFGPIKISDQVWIKSHISTHLQVRFDFILSSHEQKWPQYFWNIIGKPKLIKTIV